MRSLLRSFAVAAVVACAAVVPANAATLFPTDTFASPGGTGFFANSVTGGFTDDVVFTLVGSGVFNASFSATNAFTAAGGFIENFVISIFAGAPPVPGDGEVLVGTAPIITAGVGQSILFGGQLSAGTYFIHFSGSGITGNSATYGGSVSFSEAVSATPLPAAFSMFLDGLGVMGVLAWRRKQRVAAAA